MLMLDSMRFKSASTIIFTVYVTSGKFENFFASQVQFLWLKDTFHLTGHLLAKKHIGITHRHRQQCGDSQREGVRGWV